MTRWQQLMAGLLISVGVVLGVAQSAHVPVLAGNSGHVHFMAEGPYPRRHLPIPKHPPPMRLPWHRRGTVPP
jgi:hypothetical protein